LKSGVGAVVRRESAVPAIVLTDQLVRQGQLADQVIARVRYNTFRFRPPLLRRALNWALVPIPFALP